MPIDAVMWGETRLAYRYSFGRSRYLRITVHPDLSIEVVAPRGATLDAIRRKVLKRGSWISRARRTYARLHPLQPPRQYVPGETHRYLGRQYRLRIAQGSQTDVRLHRGFIVVTSSVRPNSLSLKRLVNDWFEVRAQEVLRERADFCLRAAEALGIPHPRLALRPMGARWGSCSRRGLVTLNTELIKAPKDCIDYVIFHELCHLVEKSHGPRFWRLLKVLVPDWEERRDRLNRMADL